jgi:hypothetical protein
MLDAGYKVEALMTAYPSFRNTKEYITKLKEMKSKYGFKLIVDSGAHAFVFGKNVKKGEMHGGWHDEAAFVKEFQGHEEDYFNEYFVWLKENTDVYDYAVELDIQSVIGQEKVEEWRNKLFESKLPIIYVLHLPAGDNAKTAKELKERGATYIGMGEIVLDMNKSRLVCREAKKIGLKVHGFGFTPKDLFKYADMFDSVDSSSWLSGSKLAKAIELKGKNLEDVNLKEDKLKKAALLRDKFFDIYGRETVEKKTKGNQYWYFNFWNLWQMQRWADINNGVKGYTKQLEAIKEGEMPAPSWMNNFDKNGVPKSRYLASRFNGFKSGAYARAIQNVALYCDQCPVGGNSATGSPLCPKYNPGDLCYFLPHWKNLGMKTRNKDQVVRTMEDLVADAMVRYQFAHFQEQLTGLVDKNVTALYRELMTSLELYNRVAFGVQNVNTLNMLNLGENKVQVNMNFDDSLEKVRSLYGEDLVKKIQKKIQEAKAEVDNDVVDQ